MLDRQQQINFTELWAHAQPTVAEYVHAIVRDPHLAKDIVQNVAVVLMNKFESWESDREFLPWAMGFAKYEILAQRRDSARSRVLFGNELLDSITQMWAVVSAEVAVEESALQNCLRKLSPKAREMVQLRYYEDLKTPEVAERTHSTAGAVRVALMRIRRQLESCVNSQMKTLEVKHESK